MEKKTERGPAGRIDHEPPGKGSGCEIIVRRTMTSTQGLPADGLQAAYLSPGSYAGSERLSFENSVTTSWSALR